MVNNTPPKNPSSLINRLDGLPTDDQKTDQIPDNKEPKPAPASQQGAKQIVKHYGIAHALFRPIGLTAALLAAIYLTITVGANFWHSYQRDLAYSKTRHIDKSSVQIFQRSFLPEDRVELVIRNYDGILEKRLASKSQLKAYMKARAKEIEAAEQQTRAALRTELAALFDKSFADKQADINAYADWFFEWKRPYVILKESLSSTTTRLVKLGEYESLRTAVERDLKDYFMKNYQQQVLKPEERDAVLVSGIETIIRRAHQNYLAMMQTQDKKMRAFIAENTTYLDHRPEDEPLTKTTLDWDAQRWQAPYYKVEDRAFDGVAGVGRVAAGGTLGALVLGPSINRGLSGLFAGLSRRFATSMGARITLAEGGAVAGTAVEPGGGTIVGAAIGVVLGFAADYVANKINEQFSREEFINTNQKALEGTMRLWKTKLGRNMETAVVKWHKEAKAGLIMARELDKPKLPSMKMHDPSLLY